MQIPLEEGVQNHIDLLTKRCPALKPVRKDILAGYRILESCYRQGGKLLLAGNGGSAADAEHIVCELMKRFAKPRPISPAFAEKLRSVDPVRGQALAEELERGLTAISLSTHQAFSTAYINDVGSQSVFAQQLFVIGRPGDVFLAISTSGCSENVIRAAVTAKAMGIHTIALTGATGGQLAKIADLTVKAPAEETYLVQELHLPIYHCWCRMLEDTFYV